MRISRDALIKLAKDNVEKRFVRDPNVTAVFLVGSLRQENAVVESAADVDLLVLHNGELLRDREIVRLSNEYHLDIAYETVDLYSQPRELRGEGWRGWAMWDPVLLFQRGKFFEYTQSVVRSQFDEPVNIIKRARCFADPAREAFVQLQLNPESATPLKLMDTAYKAGNALASLLGPPLPERKFLAEFPACARQMDLTELVQILFSTISGNISAEKIREKLPDWQEAFITASKYPGDLRLHSARLAYYKTAIESQLESDFPRSALWPMLQTWALSANSGNFNEDQMDLWQRTCFEFGMSPEQMPERMQALDMLLENMEEILEQVAADNGL